MTVHGHPGVTHCGRWIKVEPSRKHGYVTRLVCIRQPGHPMPHESADGAKWPAKRKP